ncbi:MAG: NADH dehydrogenase (quinone) subunit D [Caldilineaceae bacterium]|nr:NADH dehydrogenase (quinone) subunit D [Caldilineaceae bacterium]
MLNVSPRRREYETLPGINDLGVPALAPMPAGESEDTRRIIERFGADILAAGLQSGQQVIYTTPERLREVMTFLKKEPQLAYEALIDVTSLDRRDLPMDNGEARFQTIYQLRSYARKQHLTVVCPLESDENPQVPSLASIFKSAIWPEREVLDLMGVNFTDHPDPRRILMPDHWPYHPLRKEVPLGGEEVPFSLTFDDPMFETLGKQVLPANSVSPALPPGMNRQNMILNMGPHHPSTHGVLRLAVELDGETVLNVDPDLGYLHSGFEKTAENKRYKDFVYYTDRMDYLSGMNNNFGYVLTVEKILGLEIPERAQAIRVIMGELQRIASHLFWLSSHVLDISGTGMSLLMYATRERERIMDLFEMVCGARLTVSYIRIGGVWADLPPAFISHLQDFLDVMPGYIDDYEEMLTKGPLWEERLQGIGYISREEAIDMGLTGPMLRGSGVDWDLRRDMPYSGYENYDFDVPVTSEGDCYGRYVIRMEEMRQSLRIIRQAADNLPDGLYKTDNRKVSLPPRAELDVSMEALIHHFKLMTEGFRVPPGMFYHGIEASKGELGFFIYSDGSSKPYRLHIHGPSFNNLYAISMMSRGHMLSDIVTNIGSIDIVLGEVDR